MKITIRTLKSIAIRKGFKIDETENTIFIFKKQNNRFVCQDFRKDLIKNIKDTSLEYMLDAMEVEINGFI